MHLAATTTLGGVFVEPRRVVGIDVCARRMRHADCRKTLKNTSLVDALRVNDAMLQIGQSDQNMSLALAILTRLVF